MSGPSPRELVLDAERRFESAGLWFGHGTDNARDEAVFVVFHALGLPFDAPDAVLDSPLDAARAAAAAALIEERIRSRQPAAYLTGRMWFAGLEFAVDRSVLIPRSPIAEVIGDGFAPWIDIGRARRAIDVGTGCGCIAIALASWFPQLAVTATDVSSAALARARDNAVRLGVADRVEFVEADLFPPDGAEFDLVVSNPPYVPAAERNVLPPEYGFEPPAALFAGADGLDVLRRLVPAAADRLASGGLLVLDVGAVWPSVEGAFPRVPFTWLELDRGGEGVGVVGAEELCAGIEAAD